MTNTIFERRPEFRSDLDGYHIVNLLFLEMKRYMIYNNEKRQIVPGRIRIAGSEHVRHHEHTRQIREMLKLTPTINLNNSN